MPESPRFGGRLITLLTMAGVAIGLGNVWRFPYMMGSYGGSAFLLLYLGAMLLFGIPALCAEWSLGRHTSAGTIGAFRHCFGGRAGTALGALLVFGILIADSYYMVVIGNILFTALFSISPGFEDGTLARYAGELSDGHLQYGHALCILIPGLLVVGLGLRRGIETVSRLFVPFFGLVIVYLVIQGLLLDGAVDKLLLFLRPDFGKIGAKEVFAATGQACFSLGIGGTFMVIYGSYLRPKDPIVSTAVATGLADTGAALLAALFLVPAMLVFGLDMASGPGLIFSTLPELFAVLPLGRLAGGLFLIAFTMVAFLSAVAGLQVCFSALERFAGARLRRIHLLLLLGLVEAGLMIPTSHSAELIGKLDLVFGSGMQVFGASLAVIGMTWGLGGNALLRQIAGETPTASSRLLAFWLRYVVPVGLLIILLLSVYDPF